MLLKRGGGSFDELQVSKRLKVNHNLLGVGLLFFLQKYQISFNSIDKKTIQIQSNLDYSKCQGPPDFLRIIGSSNFQNRYFLEMFGRFRSVLIFDCISIKNGEQGIISYL